jgi:riboflavin kinase, archaea type
VKPSHIPTIVELIVEGAKDRPVPLTTVRLAKKLGRSQQMASKHLDEMEREGLIERIRSRGMTYVKLTNKGVLSAVELYSMLHSAFGKSEKVIDISGQIFNGLGEGAYYVSMNGYRKQFLAKLGFDPCPGTLNLRLLSSADRKIRRDLAVAKGIHIEGFEDGKRTYGGAECFRSLVNSKLQSAVLVIERTSYDDSVLEVIAPVNIRQTLHLKDGDRVQVTISLESKVA